SAAATCVFSTRMGCCGGPPCPRPPRCCAPDSRTVARMVMSCIQVLRSMDLMIQRAIVDSAGLQTPPGLDFPGVRATNGPFRVYMAGTAPRWTPTIAFHAPRPGLETIRTGRLRTAPVHTCRAIAHTAPADLPCRESVETAASPREHSAP